MSWKKKLAFGATLTSAATVTIHMINKFIYFSATLDNILSNPSGLNYKWKFGNVYYTKQGNGKPIILMHDLTSGSSGYEWKKIVKNLSNHNTVYCIDMLGFGKSDKPNLTYTNYLYVQLITDFIKHIVGRQSDIIATGQSAAIALAACQMDKSIIDQIILVNPEDINTLSNIPNSKTKILFNFINIPILGTFLYNILNTKNSFSTKFAEDYFYNSDKLEENLVNTYYEYAHCTNASCKHVFSSICGRYMTVNLTHCLKSLTNSIYIITGQTSSQNTGNSKKYADILPSIETASIQHTKHLPQLECPKEFIEQVDIFLSPVI